MEQRRSRERIIREIELLGDRLDAHESHCSKCQAMTECVEATQLDDMLMDLEMELETLPEVRAEAEALLHDLIEARLEVEEDESEPGL